MARIDYAKELEEQAWERGIKRGLEEGLEQGIIKTAKAMLDENSDVTFISKVTGLSKEQIFNL